MDDGPLDRIHHLVPPLEVTATAGVCVGLFAFGRMIFNTPIVVTVLGGLGVLAFGAFHEGMSLYELWGLACGLVILVAVIFMVGFFCTGQPLFGLLLLGFLVLFEKILPTQSPDIRERMIRSDHVVAGPSIPNFVFWIVGAVVLVVVGVLAHGFYVCHQSSKLLEAERRAGRVLRS